jgi:hypothetical protein
VVYFKTCICKEELRKSVRMASLLVIWIEHVKMKEILSPDKHTNRQSSIMSFEFLNFFTGKKVCFHLKCTALRCQFIKNILSSLIDTSTKVIIIQQNLHFSLSFCKTLLYLCLSSRHFMYIFSHLISSSPMVIYLVDYLTSSFLSLYMLLQSTH